ncbi:MAG: iron complex outermembrane receptor protein [Halieaceae bacterium]|jgi:iron complex outermembrane receptor protein
MHFFKKTIGALLVTSHCLSQAMAVDQELPNIIVTAEFRPQTLQSSSNSTSVVTADAIQQRAAEHLQDILNVAPNVNFSGGTSRARFIQIRGVGDRSQFQEPLNPSIGLLLDGVDFSGLGTVGTLFDIEQVEILRGPQGTLHGANALAGLINIRSKAPSEDRELNLHASSGSYNTHSVGLSSSGPLSKALGYRLALQQHRSDGYIDNTFLKRDDTSNRDELTARFRLAWNPGIDSSVDLTAMHIDVDNGYDVFSLDNDRRTRSDQPGYDRQKSNAIALRYTQEYNSVSFESSLTLAKSETGYGYDEDWTWDGFHPWGYTSTDNYTRERDSWSAEVRWLSTEVSQVLGSDWVAGLYTLSNREDLQRNNTYTEAPFTFGSSYDTDTYAAFAQFDTPLGERLTLKYGLRVEKRETEYRDSNAVGFSPEKTFWGGRIGLEYVASDTTLLYATLSRGYRANGVNADALASTDLTTDPALLSRLQGLREFDAEYLNNLEVGWKSSHLDDRLHARLAIFYMDRSDQQVKGSLVIPQGAGASSFLDFTDNAAEGNNYGLEMELDWRATNQLSLYASLGLLRTEFDVFVNVFGEDLAGRDQAQAPEYQFSIGGEYRFGNGAFIGASIDGKDDFLFSDRHLAAAQSVELVSTRLGYRGEDWEVSLWASNLTDEDYYVRGFGDFGNDPRKDYVTEPYYQLGTPRIIGLSGTVSF